MIQAAGLLVYRKSTQAAQPAAGYEVLLVHPGGPFWAKKDDWSIPKGETNEGETLLQTAAREFKEEVGVLPPLEHLVDLGSGKASSSKTNYIWAVEGDIDLKDFSCSSTVTMPWPPKSNNNVTFPENDRAEWFDINLAYSKVFKSQMVFIERLAEQLHVGLAGIIEPTNSTLF